MGSGVRRGSKIDIGTQQRDMSHSKLGQPQKSSIHPLSMVVDCNNFYVSCERVFNPALKHVPVVVLSNNDGCVISRSNEVKRLGVRMGAPAFEYRELFRRHRVAVYSTNFTLYGDLSRRVMDAIASFGYPMEVYSVDEAFLEVDPAHATQVGQAIRERVIQWTGIPVSVGIGETMTLAKAANELAKKQPRFNGVLNIAHHPEYQQLLHEVAVEDVWGIGRAWTQLLHSINVRTAWEFTHLSEHWVQERMHLPGLHTLLELRRTPCLTMARAPVPKKGIMTSRTFAKPVSDIHTLRRAIACFVSRTAEKLRSQHTAAGLVQVFLRPAKQSQQHHMQANEDHPYHARAKHMTLVTPTADTPTLIRAAGQAFTVVYTPGAAYKQVGVWLGDIVPEDRLQLPLFSHHVYPHRVYDQRRQRLMHTMDRINREWGSAAIQCGIVEERQPWDRGHSLRSQRYTTRWAELRRVHVK